MSQRSQTYYTPQSSTPESTYSVQQLPQLHQQATEPATIWEVPEHEGIENPHLYGHDTEGLQVPPGSAPEVDRMSQFQLDEEPRQKRWVWLKKRVCCMPLWGWLLLIATLVVASVLTGVLYTMYGSKNTNTDTTPIVPPINGETPARNDTSTPSLWRPDNSTWYQVTNDIVDGGPVVLTAEKSGKARNATQPSALTRGSGQRFRFLTPSMVDNIPGATAEVGHFMVWAVMFGQDHNVTGALYIMENQDFGTNFLAVGDDFQPRLTQEISPNDQAIWWWLEKHDRNESWYLRNVFSGNSTGLALVDVGRTVTDPIYNVKMMAASRVAQYRQGWKLVALPNI